MVADTGLYAMTTLAPVALILRLDEGTAKKCMQVCKNNRKMIESYWTANIQHKDVFERIVIMKVFKMDDYDWVAANSKEEAISFYTNEMGISEDELDIKECNLKKDGMFTEINLDDAIAKLTKLANGEKVDDRRSLRFSYIDSLLAIWVPFEDELKKNSSAEPFVICSTEF